MSIERVDRRTLRVGENNQTSMAQIGPRIGLKKLRESSGTLAGDLKPSELLWANSGPVRRVHPLHGHTPFPDTSYRWVSLGRSSLECHLDLAEIPPRILSFRGTLAKLGRCSRGSLVDLFSVLSNHTYLILACPGKGCVRDRGELF